MSLVELMVGLAVGLIVILSALAMYTSTSIGARNTLESATLNIAIRGAMDLMVEEIRRAGFGGDPFMVTGITDLNIQDYDGGDDNCILYSYDADLSDSTSATEYFGFRINNAVWARYGGSGDLSNCTNGSWERLTDPSKVQIDSDSGFAIDYQCIVVEANTSATDWPEGVGEECKSGNAAFVWAEGVTPAALLESRQVTINLSGAMTRDSDMRMDLMQQVHVRNHRVINLP
jgi:type II secretory pathway component PulJ